MAINDASGSGGGRNGASDGESDGESTPELINRPWSIIMSLMNPEVPRI